MQPCRETYGSCSEYRRAVVAKQTWHGRPRGRGSKNSGIFPELLEASVIRADLGGAPCRKNCRASSGPKANRERFRKSAPVETKASTLVIVMNCALTLKASKSSTADGKLNFSESRLASSNI